MNYQISRTGRKSLATELRHRVYVQSRTETRDDEGCLATVWLDGSESYPAAIYPIKAEQVAEYRTLNVEASHVVKMRGGVTIAEADRLRFGSRYFDVLTVENVQEREIVQIITCRERRQ